jgi:hypothetical protein
VESKPAVSGDGKDKHKKKKEGKHTFDPASISSKIFQGGIYEASDVITVPGTDGVLFVDDNRPDEVFWMRLDQEGNQVGEIKPIKIGVSVNDPEGITFDGSWFYVVSSQSGTKVEEPNALVRFRFDSETQSVKEVESAGGLYQFLTEGVAIRLALGGATIRSIEYDGSLNVFQIISGASEDKKKTDFKLWEWDGQTSTREKVTLNSKLKPEGVTRVSIGGHDFIFIVCDASEYLKLDD